jgi:hypothetical protein
LLLLLVAGDAFGAGAAEPDGAAAADVSADIALLGELAGGVLSPHAAITGMEAMAARRAAITRFFMGRVYARGLANPSITGRLRYAAP